MGLNHGALPGNIVKSLFFRSFQIKIKTGNIALNEIKQQSVVWARLQLLNDKLYCELQCILLVLKNLCLHQLKYSILRMYIVEETKHHFLLQT